MARARVRVSRLVAGSLALVLVLSVAYLADGSADAHAAGHVSTTPAVPKDADNAADEVSARAIAEAHGHDVVVDSLSSATVLIKARPDGLMQMVSSQVPEQAKVGAHWKPIDTTLVTGKNGFEPKNAAVPIRIGAGGTDHIVSIQTDSGEWVTETWPYGSLPAPRVKKDAAIFEDVFPGVDLRVTATKAGMREVLVVNDEQAAQDERLSALRIRVHGAQLVESVDASTLAAHPVEGEPLVASTPLWWDSSAEGATAETPGGAEAQSLTRTVAGAETVLDVGAVVEADVTYPLYIDPDFGSGLKSYWYTDRAYPNERYHNQPETKVGYGVENGIHYLSRSYHRFDTAFLAGKFIQGAVFSITQTWANSCDTNPVQLWQAGEVGQDGFAWNQDPVSRGLLLDQQVSRKGSSCEAAGAVGFTATPLVQQAAGNGSVLFALGSAAGEGGNKMTRKHYAWGSSLIVTYNSRPNTPVGLTMISPARVCATDPANPSYVNGGQAITVQVTATDPDPQNVAASFYLRTGVGGVDKGLITTPFQAQGSALRATIAANTLTDGQLYGWSSEAYDGIQTSVPRTHVCYFVVDSTKPGLPTITVESEATVDGGTFTVPTRVGEPVRVRVTPPADGPIAGYQVWWTDGAAPETSPAAPVTDYTSALPPCDQFAGPARIVCADPSGAAVFEVAPPSALASLWVAAYDRAGNVSYASASKSSAVGITVVAGNPDLSTGHAWMPYEPGDTVEDVVGSVPLRVGTLTGWGEVSTEDSQLVFPSLATLNRYVAPNWSHFTETDPTLIPTSSRMEISFGQILRPVTGDQPAGTVPFYACSWGTGNMLANTANCEGTNVSARLLGYGWKTAADVPLGMTATEIFRCRTGNDYFLSAQRACEGQVFEASRGFVGTYTPTVTAGAVVDTTASYTVSARVRPETATGTQTVVSTTGPTDSAFYLRTVGNTWQFCVRSQGVTKVTRCVDGPTVRTGRFVTVSGMWDAVNRQITITVLDGNAFTRNTVYVSLPADDVASTGVLLVGSARLSGAATYHFAGSVADVSVYPVVVPERFLRNEPIPLP